jgi:phenylacetate-CoA ligase
MPFIRYRTSDVTRLRMKQCSCGRSFPLMEDVTTKAEDIVVTKDGRFISPSTLTHPFKELENVAMSQVIQESREELTVKIVPADGFDDRQVANLIASLKERVGADMRIRIEYVPEIERTGSGKFKWVISKVPLELD